MTLQTILALLKLFPTLKKLWDQLVSEYVAAEIAKMKAEQKAAIKKAVNEQDQRDIENAIHSPRAGEVSGVPGTELVDDLPGVMPNHKP